MNIMLACAAGMSTSLVVSKMREAAESQGKDYKIWAVEQGEIQNELGNFDVLLLGKGLKKAVLEWLDYGKLRGLGQWRNSGKGRFEYEVEEGGWDE